MIFPMYETKLPCRFFLIILLLMVTGQLFFAGCAHRVEERSLSEWVAPSADRVWTPMPGLMSAPARGAGSPEPVRPRGGRIDRVRVTGR